MKTFDDLEFHNSISNIIFENGYGLFIMQVDYGFNAVPLNHEGKPFKELLLGDDFYGTLDEQDVSKLMKKLQKLKPHKTIERRDKIKKIIDE